MKLRLENIKKEKSMLRLLQGDVGSGKTIVALITLANILKKNMQAALMVPTEILAIQHFNYFSNLFEDTKINIVLLSSKINSKEKESVKKKIENGEAQIIIGTHAIFQKNVNFKKKCSVSLIIGALPHVLQVIFKRSLGSNVFPQLSH